MNHIRIVAEKGGLVGRVSVEDENGKDLGEIPVSQLWINLVPGTVGRVVLEVSGYYLKADVLQALDGATINTEYNIFPEDK